MTCNAIETRGLAKRYGEIRAVDGVDLTVEAGEIFGLIGHNGAGKSTLFKMMIGLVAPTAGEIRVNGCPVGGRGFREQRRTIGYLPEHLAFYDHLTGLETLTYFAELKGADLKQCLPLLEKVGLRDAGGRKVSGYSKGMRQRLGFAQALLGKPRLLFLDEPTNGLDPEGIREFYRILEELRREGVTVVLTSHILAEIQQRVDRLALMRQGRIQALGPVQRLREHLDLPLQVRLEAAPEDRASVREALAAQGFEADEMGADLVLDCERGRKMELLSLLAALPLRDVHLHEPSLEDVFLGYAETD